MQAQDIAALRKALKLTQKQLAQKLDVDYLLVVQWERGERFTTKKHHELLVRMAALPDEPVAATDPAASPPSPTDSPPSGVDT